MGLFIYACNGMYWMCTGAHDGVETFISSFWKFKSTYSRFYTLTHTSKRILKQSVLVNASDLMNPVANVNCIHFRVVNTQFFLFYFWSHGMHWMLLFFAAKTTTDKQIHTHTYRESEKESCSVSYIELHITCSKHAMPCHVSYKLNHFLFMFSYSFISITSHDRFLPSSSHSHLLAILHWHRRIENKSMNKMKRKKCTD